MKWQLTGQSVWEPGKPLRYRLILCLFCSILPAFSRLSRDFWKQRYFCLLKPQCVSLPWVCQIAFWTDLHFWHLEWCLAKFPQCMYSGKNIFLVLLFQPAQWWFFSGSLVSVLLKIRSAFYSYIPWELKTAQFRPTGFTCFWSKI